MAYESLSTSQDGQDRFKRHGSFTVGIHAGEAQNRVATHRSKSLAEGMSSTPLVDRFRKYHSKERGEFGFLVTLSFTVNFVMGAGFLGVPKAFYDVGMILGPALLGIVALACDITRAMLLEAMARAEAVTEHRLTDAGVSLLGAPPLNGAHGIVPVATAATPLAVDTPTRDRTRASWRPRYRITTRKFEVTELCELFMGRKGKAAYTTCVSLFNGGILWAFASVFATSCSANIPIWFINDGKTCDEAIDKSGCGPSFRVWLAVYALFVVPLSLMELKEQRALQIGMFLGRVIIILILVGTCLAAMQCTGTSFVDMSHTGVRHVPLFDIAGVPQMIAVSVYGLVVHQNIPLLAQTAYHRGKELQRTFQVSNVALCASYSLLGVLVAIYFGYQTESQCNLLWEGYVGCLHSDGAVTPEDAPAWAKVLRSFVLIFPALDVLTAYPLNAIVLGNNLLSAWAGDVSPSIEKRRCIKLTFRFIAAATPLVGAFFVHDLAKILSVTGVVGFGLAFIFPASLNVFSQRACDRIFGPVVAGNDNARTPYHHELYFKYSEHIISAVFIVVGLYTLVTSIAAAAGYSV